MMADADVQAKAWTGHAATRRGWRSWPAAVILAGAVALCVSSPAAAQEPAYVRDHRGLRVFLQPIARITDTIVFREIYREKGAKDSVNDIYAFDCKTRTLRYVNVDDGRVIKEAEFYEGVYKKAHDRFCGSYKDPHG
jgi:hypothetical protein